MREFIESMFDREKKVKFNYQDYNTLFVKEKYNTFYLFFFLNNENELLELKDKAGELYQTIKESKDIYKVDMDKNVTCIYCLCVEDEKYYETEATGTISELSKKICLVEEDLNYFKKNVLLYTDAMDKFASENIGEFDSLCQEKITESNFQDYKKNNIENYQYDFLMNLFIKLPFLNFQKYLLRNKKGYRTVSSFIDEEYNEKKIDKERIINEMNQLEGKIDDENMLYAWLDELIKKKTNVEKNISCEVINDED
ncbi:hypothetical protein EHE19_006530 [Ruminiclostridium herbifermentans]|uniref:Uncharacterized protein n=1 Tax=Ruminiclostridium herbifermentans TaxID=2488810 RepID=A0A4V6EP68_9FIRM|nr:ABC-three component system middle component 1 [Ruminiclostridium herbifermentans]QNU68089.1 hypothetical protein EHE19_006530 [Ruminiclostridium herbifermentans]